MLHCSVFEFFPANIQLELIACQLPQWRTSALLQNFALGLSECHQFLSLSLSPVILDFSENNPDYNFYLFFPIFLNLGMIRTNNGGLLPGAEGKRFAPCGFVSLKGILTQYSSRSWSVERAQFYFLGSPQDLKLLENFLATNTLHCGFDFLSEFGNATRKEFFYPGLNSEPSFFLLISAILILIIKQNKTNQGMFFLYWDMKI